MLAGSLTNRLMSESVSTYLTGLPTYTLNKMHFMASKFLHVFAAECLPQGVSLKTKEYRNNG